MKGSLVWRLVAPIAGLLLLAGLVSGCAKPGRTSGAANSLKIALYPGSLISFPARVALDEGIFKKHGLDVKLIDVPGGPDASAAVVSGSADIQLNSMDNLMLAREQNQDMVAVSGNTRVPIFSVVVNKAFKGSAPGAFPASIKQLKGAKIGVTQRGASVELVMRYLLEKAGLNADKDVTFVAVGTPPTALPALKNKRVDALVGFEPEQTQAVTLGKYANIVFDLRTGTLPPELQLLDWNYNQWAGLKANIDRKKTAFKNFQAAMQETFTFMADPANNAKLVKDGLKDIANDSALIPQMLKANLDTFGYKIEPAKVKNTSDFLLQFKKIKKPVAFESIVDPGAR
jgi:NitT/TauT family transport system substrate-binding protein